MHESEPFAIRTQDKGLADRRKDVFRPQPRTTSFQAHHDMQRKPRDVLWPLLVRDERHERPALAARAGTASSPGGKAELTGFHLDWGIILSSASRGRTPGDELPDLRHRALHFHLETNPTDLGRRGPRVADDAVVPARSRWIRRH